MAWTIKSSTREKFIDKKIHRIQRAKQSWFFLRDWNTNFFETIATIRKPHNTTRRIKDTHGNWFDDQPGITQVITREFENKFKSDLSCTPTQAIPFPPDISNADNDLLTREVTDDEILNAVKQISPLKALGSDGMLVLFYQKNWDLVGRSVCKMVKSFST